jgi:hypothetical protein
MYQQKLRVYFGKCPNNIISMSKFTWGVICELFGLKKPHQFWDLCRHGKWEIILADVDTPAFASPFIYVTQPHLMHMTDIVGTKSMVSAIFVNKSICRFNQRLSLGPVHFIKICYTEFVSQYSII